MERYAKLLNYVKRGQKNAEQAPNRWIAGGVTLILFLLLLGNAGRIARMIRTRGLQAHPERSPDQAAAMWYERMSRSLARRGVKKSVSQTPQEFVRVIVDEPSERIGEPIHAGLRIGKIRQFSRPGPALAGTL